MNANARNYFHLMTILEAPEDEEPSEPPMDDESSGEEGSEKPKVSSSNQIEVTKMDDEIFKKKIIHLIDYFVSVILDDKMYFLVNKNKSKFLSKSLENLNELLKTKVNKSFSKYVNQKIMNTQIIQNIIDSFSFIRLKNSNVIDDIFMTFNKKNIFKLFFEKTNKGYKLVRVDLANLGYTKQQIRNDIFKFISDSIFNYKKET